MKIYFVLLVAFVSSLYAASGDAIFSQPYSFTQLASCVQSASLADDFVPYFTGDCSSAKVWMVFQNAPVTELFIKIARNTGDLNPNNSLTVFAEVLPVSLMDTGDSLYGEPVYELTLDFSTALQLTAGELYWFEVGTQPGSYWAYQQPVMFGFGMWNYLAGHYVEFGDSDGFFELLTPVALERNSWAAIKSHF